MWCTICQQDVPAITLGESDSNSLAPVVCIRCGEPIHTNPVLSTSTAGKVPSPPADFKTNPTDLMSSIHDPAMELEDLDLEENLKSIESMLSEVGIGDMDIASRCALENTEIISGSNQYARFDPPHLPELPATIKAYAQPADNETKKNSTGSSNTKGKAKGKATKPGRRNLDKKGRFRIHPLAALVIWILKTSGLVALVGGGALLGWSLMENRTELWRLGMPLLLGGQGGLLIGLLLQLDRVGRENREVHRRLCNLDEQLLEWKQTNETSSANLPLSVSELLRK